MISRLMYLCDNSMIIRVIYESTIIMVTELYDSMISRVIYDSMIIRVMYDIIIRNMEPCEGVIIRVT
jgi:hypothetical protein